MGQVARLPHVPPTVGTAVDNYLDGVELALTTRRVYTASLTGPAGGLGPDTRLGEVDAATVEGWFRRRYDGVSPATWNRELATLRSAIRWWRAQGLARREPDGWAGPAAGGPGPDPGVDLPAGRDPVATGRAAAGEDAVAAAV